jgi:predicted permease
MALGSLADVFVGTVLPVLSIAGVGYLLGLFRDVDVGPLNTVTLYVLLPALILHSLVTSPLGGRAAARLFAAIAAFTLVMLALGWGVGRALGETGPRLSALTLAAAFPNVGNFGIPVSEFAFGSTGRTTAVLFVVGQQVVLYTVGVYVASRGSHSPREAVGRVLRLPLLPVVAVGLAVSAAGVAPPSDGTAMETLALVGNASIPVFLLILGLELADADSLGLVRRTSPAVALKLLVAPAVGVALAVLLGFQHTDVARTFALETAAPVAITPLALLVEFAPDDGADVSGPAYMSSTILLTMLGSVPVVTLLIAALRGGLVG